MQAVVLALREHKSMSKEKAKVKPEKIEKELTPFVKTEVFLKDGKNWEKITYASGKVVERPE